MSNGDSNNECGVEVRSLFSEPFQVLPLALDKGLPLDQIFGGITTCHLLGEESDRDIVGGHLAGRRDHAVNVGVDSADCRVDAPKPNLD